MQCLAACPPVAAALNASTSKGPIAALRSLINSILETQGDNRLSTRAVRDTLESPFNSTGIAHDIGELLDATLQAMTLKCPSTGTLEEPATEALSFASCATTTCLKCQTERGISTSAVACGSLQRLPTHTHVPHDRARKACNARKASIGRQRSISRIKHDLHREDTQRAHSPANPVCGSRAQRLPGCAHVPMTGRAGHTRLGTRPSVGGGRCPEI